MLVLRRKIDETLVINGAVTICILGVEGERVKLGVIAPDDVVIVRGELLNAEQQQHQLRRKREELARTTDPRQREKLEGSIARLEQSQRFTQSSLAPANLEARQE